jgi:long-chain fatty acid transport protein
MKKSRLLFTIAFALTLSGQLMAAGYQVLLQGNRSTAMGNLGVALRPDASSLFFNPGSMIFMDHNSIFVGANFINSNIQFWNSTTEFSNYTARTDNPTGTPFQFFAVWGPEDSKFKFGLGAFTPFGSSVRWEQGWAGRDLLNELSLQAIVVQPTLSYKITDRLGIGGGLNFAFGNVNLQRTLLLDTDAGEGQVELDGKADLGFGFNIGMFYQASDKVNLGMSYRSRIDMNITGGSAEFTVPTAIRPQFPTGNTFNSSLPLPSVFTAGVGYLPTEKLELGFQVDFVGWSAYESLEFDFANNSNLLQDISAPRNYQNSWVFHLGGEYKTSEKFALRAGAYYDLTPVEKGFMTAETPDANRIGLTAGVGIILDRINIDFSILYIAGAQREQTVQDAISAGTLTSTTRQVLPGTYQLKAFIPGISIAYKF